MAIVNYSYCNASLGKIVNIQFDQGLGASNSIVGHSLTGNCSSPQPTIIAWIPSPISGGLPIGYLVPLNVAPYAQYVPTNASECSAFQFDGITVGKATNNLTSDGSLIINVVGKNLYTTYEISGPSGTITQADTSVPNANVFTGLKPGLYTVTVSTRGFSMFGTATPCVIQQQVTVGQNNVICDLTLGSIVTEASAGASNGKIKVLNLTGFQAPVEYRLDSGAWQDSAEFTGLDAGTYNVQVRYRDYTSCSDSREVIVSDNDSCDISIEVFAVHEQSKYAKDGIIQVLANGSNPPYQYSIDNGDTYQDSNTFYNLEPGVYPVRVLDSVGCEDAKEVTIYKYKKPHIVFPRVNSHRFVVQTGPTVKVNRKQNFDNTLFADMHFPGVMKGCYSEKVLRADNNAIQFQSSFALNTIRLYNEDDVLKATYAPTKKTNYMNYTETLPAFFANYGGGKVQVYFQNGLPYYVEEGMDITISENVTLNGTYQVEEIIPGVGIAAGFMVALITAPSISSGSGSVIFEFDLEPYEIYELSIPWGAFNAGKYYMTAEGYDDQFPGYTAKSEPVESAEDWLEHILLEYKNFENNFGIDYTTGIVHRMRVPGELRWPTFGGERTVYKDSRLRTIKLMEETTRHPELNVFDVPPYLLERIKLASSMDWFTADDVEYQTEDDMEVRYNEHEAVHGAMIKLIEVDFNQENTDDQGPSADVDILGDNDSVMGVL